MTNITDKHHRAMQVKEYFTSKHFGMGYAHLLQLAGGDHQRLLEPGVYDYAVKNCKKLPIANNNVLEEEHHIIPLFDRGTDVPENRIKVGYLTHCCLHFIRWIEFSHYYDFCAGNLRVTRVQKGFSPKEYGTQLNLNNKKLGRGWYNSKTQSELGKKGGKKGGAVNSVAQQKVRQEMGKSGKGGRGNQSSVTKTLLQQTGTSVWMYWSYQEPGTENYDFFCVESSFTSIHDLAARLFYAKHWMGFAQLTPAVEQAIRNAAISRGTQAGWACRFMVTNRYCNYTLDELADGKGLQSIYMGSWGVNVLPLELGFDFEIWYKKGRIV